MVNFHRAKELHGRLHNACLTKSWDYQESIQALNLIDSLIESYSIIFARYFEMLNMDISELEDLEDLMDDLKNALA
jgi:hypothetical protein